MSSSFAFGDLFFDRNQQASIASTMLSYKLESFASAQVNDLMVGIGAGHFSDLGNVVAYGVCDGHGRLANEERSFVGHTVQLQLIADDLLETGHGQSEKGHGIQQCLFAYLELDVQYQRFVTHDDVLIF